MILRARGQARRAAGAYEVYGVRLRSHWPLPCPGGARSGLPTVHLVEGPPDLFRTAQAAGTNKPRAKEWFCHRRLADASDYLRWSGLFEFLVSADGRRIAGRPLNGTLPEAFHTYLLGQALSFALLKRGIEPLHSTAVVIDGEAVGFFGDCGSGKSSLAGAFLQAGYPVLTDDLLVVREEGRGYSAYPGPPRIKLFPHIARRLLGPRVAGTPMNPLTPKLVIPLGRGRPMARRGPAPLKAIYVLRPRSGRGRSDRITIRPLRPRRAFVELLKGTFNAVVVEPARLRRQLDLTARLARAVPVRSLSFPRRLARLPAVRDAILSDLRA